ncbi:MAG: TPM domain-containing protein [Pseudobutyrivibrio sp.]|nr:TPM domain-containing protein [Pseudobutyrivibrio sp.]
MRKFLSSLFIVFALVFIFPLTAAAVSSNVKIVDDAGILTNEETEELEEYLEALDGAMNYLVVTCDDRAMGSSALEKLDNYYRQEFDDNEDGIAFIVDMDTRRIELQGRNKLQYSLDSGDCTDITDNVYSYASDGDYYNCIYHAFRQADLVANYKFVLRPMRIIVSLLIAIIIGFLGTFLKAMADRSKENEIKGAPEMILVGATFKGLAHVYDSKKRKVREQSHYSGGSSHGGGYSGGGFSSGGGGGFSSGGGGGGGFSSGGHSF